jgi:hypothetical protein
VNTRALNRVLLARQGLLERWETGAADALERLVGMQSQEPQAPYVGLFSRLRGFRPQELSELLAARGAVRMGLMRSTLHTVTARDALALAPLFAGMGFSASPFARRLSGLDLAPVRALARSLLDAQPRTLAALRTELAARWPDRDPDSLAYAIRYHEPIVQIPPRGLWQRSGRATWAHLETWAGPLRPGTVEDLLERYLRAFGPATVSDMRAWSGLSDLRSVVSGMSLVDRGDGLLDVHDGELPDETASAPPRFLPPYDNVLVAYQDRTRLIAAEDRDHVVRNLGRSYLLVDGWVGGEWRIEGETLHVRTFRPVAKRTASSIAAEGRRLLAFMGVPAGEVRL